MLLQFKFRLIREKYLQFTERTLPYVLVTCAVSCAERTKIENRMAEVDGLKENDQNNSDFKDPLGVKDPLGAGQDTASEGTDYEVRIHKTYPILLC